MVKYLVIEVNLEVTVIAYRRVLSGHGNIACLINISDKHTWNMATLTFETPVCGDTSCNGTIDLAWKGRNVWSRSADGQEI
jgi:hypothetical protein